MSTVQPVSLRQSRGARLSFLGGRKKDHSPSSNMKNQNSHLAVTTNGNGTTNSIISEQSTNDSSVILQAHPTRKSLFPSSSSSSIAQQLPLQAPPPSSASSGMGLGYGVSVSAGGNHVGGGGASQSHGSRSRSGTDTSDWVTDSGIGAGGRAGSVSGSGRRASYDTQQSGAGGQYSIGGRDEDSESFGAGASPGGGVRAGGGVGAPKLGGMKRRLSMLKLGGKKGKNHSMMGALNEE